MSLENLQNDSETDKYLHDMGKLALKIYKALYGLDIRAQNTELTRLRLENKRLSELLRSTSREYNSLNEKYKKNKESINSE